MIRKYFIFFLFFSSLQALPQAALLNWQISIGGSNDDYGYSIFQSDSVVRPYIPGYRVCVAGYTKSDDGLLTNCQASGTDALLMQIDTQGTYSDCRVYSGSGYEVFNKGRYGLTTSNAPYIQLVGRTTSSDGDFSQSGYHGYNDAFIVSMSPNFLIEYINKCYGGKGWEDAFDIIEMPDHGFLVCGISSSDTINGQPTNNKGAFDGWVFRTDQYGNMLWNKQYGGRQSDYLYSIAKSSDGNYVLAGLSNSDTIYQEASHGSSDYWVIKIDQSGNLLWNKLYGGSSMEWGYTILPTFYDDGFIMCGQAYSNDGDVSGNHSNLGSEDVWIIKLDSVGSLIWSKCFGGASMDWCKSMTPAPNNEFIVVAYTDSWGNNPSGCQSIATEGKAWVFKIDSLGNIVWNQCFGTIGVSAFDHFPEAIMRSDQNHYYFINHIYQSGGNVTNFYGGLSDIWLAKIEDNYFTGLPHRNNNLTSDIYPNPFNNYLKINVSSTFGLISSFKIYDIYGRLVYQGVSESIDSATWPAGIYIAEVTTKEKVVQKKLLKQ